MNTKEEEDYQTYKETKVKLKKSIKTKKKSIWVKKCRDIGTYIRGSKCSQVWGFMKTLKNSGENRTHLQMISLTKWKKHYQDLFQENKTLRVNLNNKYMQKERALKTTNPVDLKEQIRLNAEEGNAKAF